MRAAADHNEVAGPVERAGTIPTGVPAARGAPVARLPVPEPAERAERVEPGAPAVSITDLHVVHRRETLLTGVSCRIAPGAVTAIVGSADSGASALLRVIAGRLRATCGSATVLGLPPGDPALRRRVRFAPAGEGGVRGTVMGHLQAAAGQGGADGTEVARALGDAGLAELSDARSRELTPQQRLAARLAGFGLAGYEVVLLEDPTAGLDPVDREACWRQLRALAARGTAVVLATPSTADAKHCTRAVLMRGGGVLADDTPARLRAATGTGDLDEAFLRLAAEGTTPAR